MPLLHDITDPFERQVNSEESIFSSVAGEFPTTLSANKTLLNLPIWQQNVSALGAEKAAGMRHKYGKILFQATT